MFLDKENPTMNELINFVAIKYPEIWESLNDSQHAYTTSEPNPYHLENSVLAHTMMVALQAENDNANKIGKICALLHDVGKPLARITIPFNKKKPVYTESNEIRSKSDDIEITSQREFKTAFRGHEGISFYIAAAIIKELIKIEVIDTVEAEEILTIINLHGTLFNHIKDGKEFNTKKLISKWRNYSPSYFTNFINQVRYDSTGRFYISKDGRKSDGSKLGTELFGPEFIKEMENEKDVGTQGTQIIPENTITVLVGIPCVGKSTWLDKNKTNEVILSRDNVLMNYGKEKYGLDLYSNIWEILSNDDHKEIDKILQNKYQTALRNKQDIIVDMTNTSPKSRRKWLANPKNYFKKAVVFAVGYEEILKRNKSRSLTTGKYIPNSVFKNMMCAFSIPQYDEVHHIDFVFE